MVRGDGGLTCSRAPNDNNVVIIVIVIIAVVTRSPGGSESIA